MPDRRPARRMPALALTLTALVVPMGCGDDDEGGEAAQPRTVAIELSGSDKKLRFTVPDSVPAGLTRVQFRNSAKGDHGAQLIYVDEGRTVEAGLRAAQVWGERGRPLPSWVHLAGGVGNVKSGETGTATQRLPAGEYVVVDIDSNTNARFRVTSDGGGGEPPSTSARIEATEYQFDSQGLTAGRNAVLYDNAGREPHFVEGLPIKPGKTIADVRQYIRNDKGEPPFTESGLFVSAVTDGGVAQTLELDLRPGKYALLCFVPDRKGGPPHAVKGMVSEATVR
jgi:hypothetical protein